MAALTMLLALFVPLASANAQEAAEEGGTLDATPEDATNLTDEDHTIEGVLDLADDEDESDQRLRAELAEDPEDETFEGGDSFDGGLSEDSEASCVTDEDGACELVLNEVTDTVLDDTQQQESTGTVTAPGKDRLRVYHDANDNGQFDEDTEDYDFVFKTWVDETSEGEAVRLWGDDRIETAIDISQDHWADTGATPEEGQESAEAVVLARADLFPDALAGTPFAVLQNAPLLLSFPDSLDERTEDELQRVLAEDGTVYLLGGDHALSQAVEDRIEELGYNVERLFGETRFQTATDIAEQTEADQGTLDHLFIARSHEFPDALAGGAAAANIENFDAEATEGEVGAILLTFHDQKHEDTEAFIDARADATTYALGGPIVNPYSCAVDVEVADTWYTQSDCSMDEDADEPADWGIFGENRQETSRAISEFFFTDPVNVGLARGDEFPDALTGGAHIGQLNGPILLTQTGALDQDPQRYFCWTADTIETGYIYGGNFAIAPDTMTAADGAIDGTNCPEDGYDLPKGWVGS